MTMPTRSSLAGRRAVVVNWRDPWHSLAGGSERYAWEFARALRAAGVRVEFLTAREPGQRAAEIRDGIEIRRAGGPFTFYAHAALRLLQRRRRLDIVVDPECGIPTFSPLFVRRDTAVVLVLHHVHQEQFRHLLPGPAGLGRAHSRAGRDASRLPAARRPSRCRSPRAARCSTQLGWNGPVGILGNGARCRRRPRRPGRREGPRPAGRPRAGWCRTSGSTWSSRRCTRSARSGPTCASTCAARVRTGRGSRS